VSTYIKILDEYCFETRNYDIFRWGEDFRLCMNVKPITGKIDVRIEVLHRNIVTDLNMGITYFTNTCTIMNSNRKYGRGGFTWYD